MEITNYPLPKPTEKVSRDIIVSFDLFRLNVVPNLSANIGLWLKTEDSSKIISMNLTLEGPAYDAWETDDYLIKWITEQIYIAYPPPV
jgi:hypothetical protein